jgi:hypothetical protein
MRESCVSSVENGKIWWFGSFSVASRTEILDMNEESSSCGGRLELSIEIRTQKYLSILSLSSIRTDSRRRSRLE